jgi:hypothetical protein
LNQRPSGYEPDELPDCSIPHQRVDFIRPNNNKSKLYLKLIIYVPNWKLSSETKKRFDELLNIE